MHSAEINLFSMRNRIHQQLGVALIGDPSPAIGKLEHQHPWMPVTPESPVIQSSDVLSPPEFPSRDDCSDDQHQDGEMFEPVPNDSTREVPFSRDDSRVKERAAYINFKHQLTGMSRLSEGHGFQEVASCLMLLGRDVLAGAH